MSDISTSINTISSFLAFNQLDSLTSLPPSSSRVVVLCGSAILPTASAVFSSLAHSPTLASTLVICGGIGHSTQLLYDAVRAHPVYHPLASDTSLSGLPESRVLFQILQRFHPDALSRFEEAGGKVLVEEQSTNCGANAVETRKVLEENEVSGPGLEEVVVVQDPTMARRTVAGFEKVYADAVTKPKFICCPTFTPVVENAAGDAKVLGFVAPPANPPGDMLWKMPRFIDLLLGEIPRLRDDENGYGPRGKGFIAYVEVPEEVEEAWRTLNEEFGDGGGMGRGKMV